MLACAPSCRTTETPATVAARIPMTSGTTPSRMANLNFMSLAEDGGLLDRHDLIIQADEGVQAALLPAVLAVGDEANPVRARAILHRLDPAHEFAEAARVHELERGHVDRDLGGAQRQRDLVG